MRSAFEQMALMIKEVTAVRCQVCQARVRRCKDAPLGFRCPKCGRDYHPKREPLVRVKHPDGTITVEGLARVSVPTEPPKDADKPPSSVFEAFGHNEQCGKWVEGETSISLDPSRACTCGGKPLAAVVAPPPQEQQQLNCEICGVITKYPMVRCTQHLQRCDDWIDSPAAVAPPEPHTEQT